MLLLGDCNHWLKEIKDNSIDLLLTDPPYGIEFMGKDWDRAIVSTETWKECYRVLKEGKLAFVMCSPRQDVLSRMIINLQDAGFRTNYTSIYWTYASGFPKAANVSKLIDKKNGRYFDTSVKDYLNQKRKEKGFTFNGINRFLEGATNGGGIASAYMGDKQQNELPTLENYQKLKVLLELDDRFDELIATEEAEREIIEKRRVQRNSSSWESKGMLGIGEQNFDITKPATEAAKKMEGAYVGFQPKPAVEVILVLSKGKTLTWLDDCRIPYNKETDTQPRIREDKHCFHSGDIRHGEVYGKYNAMKGQDYFDEKGRFPANLLVSDDALNDGIERLSKWSKSKQWHSYSNSHMSWVDSSKNVNEKTDKFVGDSGSYSRYFSLDAWADKQKKLAPNPEKSTYNGQFKWTTHKRGQHYPDEGKTEANIFPFIITPKASRSERNKGCEDLPMVKGGPGFREYHGETKTVRKNPLPDRKKFTIYLIENIYKKYKHHEILANELGIHESLIRQWIGKCGDQDLFPTPEYYKILKQKLDLDDRYDKQMMETIDVPRDAIPPTAPRQNHHPTVKPLKLMSYLITMGSREGDLVLDPFCGSGTVCIAADQLHRKWLGIEMNPEYAQIIKKRLMVPLSQLKLSVWSGKKKDDSDGFQRIC